MWHKAFVNLLAKVPMILFCKTNNSGSRSDYRSEEIDIYEEEKRIVRNQMIDEIKNVSTYAFSYLYKPINLCSLQ